MTETVRIVRYTKKSVVVALACRCCQGTFQRALRLPTFCSGACRVANHRAYHMKGGRKRGQADKA
jgi:hypothetical protein